MEKTAALALEAIIKHCGLGGLNNRFISQSPRPRCLPIWFPSEGPPSWLADSRLLCVLTRRRKSELWSPPLAGTLIPSWGPHHHDVIYYQSPPTTIPLRWWGTDIQPVTEALVGFEPRTVWYQPILLTPICISKEVKNCVTQLLSVKAKG